MPRAAANGIEIEYECLGAPENPPLVLVRGLSTQMIHWHPEFLRGLAERGHFVVAFDNRDVGKSSWFDDAGMPDLGAVLAGNPTSLAYGLEDMADDIVGLLDALQMENAHIAGMSMGGMIVQLVALRHPGRVRSLTSVMSSTGAPDLPPPTPEALESLLSPSPEDREGSVAHTVRTQRVISSPGYPFDEGYWTDLAGRAWDRAFHPAGVARQFAAIQAAPSRRAALAEIDVPTLVLHGSGDVLIHPEHGRDTAAAIPGATLHILEGMGHDIPYELHGELIGLLSDHTSRAEER